MVDFGCGCFLPLIAAYKFTEFLFVGPLPLYAQELRFIVPRPTPKSADSLSLSLSRSLNMGHKGKSLGRKPDSPCTKGVTVIEIAAYAEFKSDQGSPFNCNNLHVRPGSRQK